MLIQEVSQHLLKITCASGDHVTPTVLILLRASRVKGTNQLLGTLRRNKLVLLTTYKQSWCLNHMRSEHVCVSGVLWKECTSLELYGSVNRGLAEQQQQFDQVTDSPRPQT